MAKKAPTKPPAKRKPRAKKPETLVVPIVDTTDYGTPEGVFPLWFYFVANSVCFAIAGLLIGICAAGGIDVSPSPGPSTSDCLSQSHAADRVSQIRILREYAGKSFADEPTAQKWLNDQRIEARKADWIPYTDELGSAADSGIDAVKALADKLEGKR